MAVGVRLVDTSRFPPSSLGCSPCLSRRRARSCWSRRCSNPRDYSLHYSHSRRGLELHTGLGVGTVCVSSTAWAASFEYGHNVSCGVFTVCAPHQEAVIMVNIADGIGSGTVTHPVHRHRAHRGHCHTSPASQSVSSNTCTCGLPCHRWGGVSAVKVHVRHPSQHPSV